MKSPVDSSPVSPALTGATPTTETAAKPATCPCRDEVLAGMSCVDTSANLRIPILMSMVGALSRAREPADVLREFSTGMDNFEDRPGYVSISTRGLAPGEYRITRLITDDVPGHLPESDPWHNRDSIPVHSGGFFGEIIRQAYPEIIHNLDVRDDPVLGDALKNFGSLMAIPLFDDGEPLNWAVMLRRATDGFTESELEESIVRSNLVGTTVRNVLTAQRLREANEQVQREVDQIARIQRALLPQSLPDIAGVSIGASFETFDTAGGDIYDFVPLRNQADGRTPDPSGPWGIQIADASGHGPAATTIVAMLNAILAASPDEWRSPAAMASFANDHLMAKRLEGTFVTALLCRYDPSTRRLTYARAGHPPALLMSRRDDKVTIQRLNDVGGIPLGVLDEETYEEVTVQLERGQTLVLYTDGITEAMNPDGVMFDVAGIERSLTECSGEPDCVIHHVTTALKTHEAGVRPSDDQTLLVLRIND